MRWSLLLLGWISGLSMAFAQTGVESPDHHWKIEIQEERQRNPATNDVSPPQVRIILHDLIAQKSEVVLNASGYWLPSPKDARQAIWRSDGQAFTLPDYARKWNGFSVYVRQPKKWVLARQSNDFMGNHAQVGGVITRLCWVKDGTLHFEFHTEKEPSRTPITFLVTEGLVNEATLPEVIYLSGMTRPVAASDF